MLEGRPPGRGPLGEPRLSACLARGGLGGGGIARPEPDRGGAPGGGGIGLPLPDRGGAGVLGGGPVGAEPMSRFACPSRAVWASSALDVGRLEVSSTDRRAGS